MRRVAGMGAAVAAFGDGLGVVRRNPRYVLVTMGAFLASLAAGLLLSVVPVVGQFVNTLVVAPVVVALLLGMALAGLSGEADAAAGVEHAKSDYVNLAGAYALLLSFGMATLFPLAFVGTFVAVLLFGPDTVQTDPAAFETLLTASSPTAVLSLVRPELFLVVGALSLPVLFVLLVVMQFVGVAVVAGDASMTDAFRVSWQLFRSAPASVLGYTLARIGVLAASVAIPAGAFLAARSLAGFVPGVLAAAVVAAVTVPLGLAHLNAYHVAYFERRTSAA